MLNLKFLIKEKSILGLLNLLCLFVFILYQNAQKLMNELFGALKVVNVKKPAAFSIF